MESVPLFDREGQPRLDRPRWDILRTPYFGANVSDRPYFAKAANCEWTRLDDQSFVMEQLFSKPDGQRKTVFIVPVTSSSRRENCDPQLFAISTGHLQTFRDRSLSPGFSYAVVDWQVSTGPNVLFHSNRDAELIDRFEDDLDSSSFRDLLRSLPADGRAVPLDTYYQATPVRLWMSRLARPSDGWAGDDLPWALILIEDRSQASYAIWRNAMFGYVGWFTAAAIALFVWLWFFARYPRAVDRKPAMWLWPARELSQWTIQHQSEIELRNTVLAARRSFLFHVLTAVPLLLAALAAPSTARLALALAVGAYVSAGHSLYGGTLAGDAAAARKLDQCTCWIAFAFGIVGLVTLGFGLFNFTELAGDAPGWMALRFLVAAAAAGWICIRMWRWVWESPASTTLPGGIQSAMAGLPDIGWMLAVVLMAAAPAAGGFLDGFVTNREWAAEAERKQRGIERADCVAHLDKINRTLQPVARPLPDEGCGPEAKESAVTSRSAAAFIVDWLDYRPATIQYSQTPKPEWLWPRKPNLAATLLQPLWLLLPLVLLGSVLILFRRQYFSPTPPGSLNDPLLTTTNVIDQIVAAVQDQGNRFVYSPFKRHLVVGADQRLQEDPRLSAANITLIDLLCAPEQKPAGSGYVVYNFEAAVLGKETCDAALKALEDLVKAQNAAPSFHLFLLAQTEPLDRIVFSVEERRNAGTGEVATESCAVKPELRWAEMLQSFALYSVKPPPPSTAVDLFGRELEVVDIPIVTQLKASGFTPPPDADDDQIVAFVTDFLAEHYRMLWETSTPDEKVILFNLAVGAHLKMRDSFALRSLLLRRLVVLAPEYRLMNLSFARFVRSVADPAGIEKAARKFSDGIDPIWPVLKLPLALVALAGLLVLAIVSPREIGLAALIPAITAALPALLSSWSSKSTVS